MKYAKQFDEEFKELEKRMETLSNDKTVVSTKLKAAAKIEAIQKAKEKNVFMEISGDLFNDSGRIRWGWVILHLGKFIAKIAYLLALKGIKNGTNKIGS